MKSALVYELTSPLNLAIKETSIDVGALKPEEIYAETEFSAVSTGTEIAAWVGKPPLRPSTTYPRLIGYCNLAKVVEVGRSIQGISPGDHILTHQSHRTAFVCNKSEVLLSIKDKSPLDRKKLSATYLYHLGYSAIQQGDFRPGMHVAIIGLGTLGLTTASLLSTFGCTPLLFTNQIDSGIGLKSLRNAHRFTRDPAELSRVREITGMDGVDLVINTSNAWSDHLLCMRLARKGATIVNMGFPGRGEVPPDFNPLDSQYYYDKQITFKHCGYTTDVDLPAADIRFTKKRNLRYLADLILSERLDPYEVLSFETPWTELKAAYETLASRKPGQYSALMLWTEKIK